MNFAFTVTIVHSAVKLPTHSHIASIKQAIAFVHCHKYQQDRAILFAETIVAVAIAIFLLLAGRLLTIVGSKLVFFAHQKFQKNFLGIDFSFADQIGIFGFKIVCLIGKSNLAADCYRRLNFAGYHRLT